jgi:Transglycosylase SLT domain
MLVETISAIGSSVTGAIRQAAQATGTGFSYLLATAKIESGLDPKVKASTSSATGLFQFIEQTWLMTMKLSGSALGYGRYADAIERTSSGRYAVRDPGLRAEILNLRKDPAANAAMAGALTQHNAARLKTRIGREPTAGELYIAHFLGAGGASKLINSAAKNPGAKAADLFPRAAAANRSIFYDKQGGARSVTGVYGLLVTKLARAMPANATAQIAQAPAPTPAPAPTQPADAAPSLFSPARVSAVSPPIPMPPLADSVAPLMFVQQQASPPAAKVVTTVPVESAAPTLAPSGQALALAAVPAPAVAAPLQVASAPAAQPVFYDLFRTDGRGAVSQAVSELWSVRPASPAAAAAGDPRRAARLRT